MNKVHPYRENGAVGALLDEYERAIHHLIQVIDPIPPDLLIKIIDHDTEDLDCRSIQTILTHVVESGYTYVIEIRKSLGENVDYSEKVTMTTTQQYQSALIKMFNANELLFKEYPSLQLCEYDTAKKFVVRWGQTYDVEQILEHAIVHILRHRRQIERFLLIQWKEFTLASY